MSCRMLGRKEGWGPVDEDRQCSQAGPWERDVCLASEEHRRNQLDAVFILRIFSDDSSYLQKISPQKLIFQTRLMFHMLSPLSPAFTEHSLFA